MKDTKQLGEAYYKALGKKDLESVKTFLHPNIQFTDPQETVNGRDTVLQAAFRFSKVFTSLKIQSKFGSENQALIIYDVDIPGFAKPLRAASLLSFQENLISKIELIYDTKDFPERQS